MAQTTETAAPTMNTFAVHPQLLASGKVTTTLANTDLMACTVFVADAGGETVVHSHSGEDQVFLILRGEATFYDSLEHIHSVLGPLQGIVVPRGSVYWYEKSSADNLVMVRFGAKAQNEEQRLDRFSPPLRVNPPVVPIEGAVFDISPVKG